MDYENFFPERLAKLRVKAGLSARDMSLSMGQSPGYINKIESKQNLPSMAGFFYICEELKITPKEFFDDGVDDPERIKRILLKLNMLPEKKLKAIEIMLEALSN